MRPIRKFLLLAAISGLTAGEAQTNDIQNAERKYTPNSISIFNTMFRKGGDRLAPQSDLRHVVKFAPSLLIRQKAALFYETKISGGLVITAGIGKPFGTDFFQSLFFDAFSKPSDMNVLSAAQIYRDALYTGSGPFLHGGVKLFFSEVAFDGGYFEVFYRYDRLSYLLEGRAFNINMKNGNSVDFKTSHIAVGFGEAWTSGSKSRVTHDVFFNVGIKLVNYTKFEVDPFFAAGVFYTRSGFATVSERVLPAISAGYAFGFGF